MMEPTIIDIEERKLVGMHVSTSLAANNTGELWQQFMPRRNEILNKVNRGFYSVHIYDGGLKIENFTKDTRFEKWAAVEVTNFDDVPEGMESLTLSGGKYAVFIHKGPVATFHKTTEHIFEKWLPSSEYELDEREHFEIMGEKYLGARDPKSEEEVWIPIRKKTV